MKYRDLREFLGALEAQDELRHIRVPVSTVLEMTEISDRVLRQGGPALLFDQPRNFNIPVLTNLFGTPGRVALAMGRDSIDELREVGKLLAFLKEPEPPQGVRDAFGKLPLLKQALWDMAPKEVSGAACQHIVWEGDDVDLANLPVQTCWPGDVGPLITWGLTVTPASLSSPRSG